MPCACRPLTSCFSSTMGAAGPAADAHPGSGAKKERGARPQGPSPEQTGGVSSTAVAPRACRWGSLSSTPRNLPAQQQRCGHPCRGQEALRQQAARGVGPPSPTTHPCAHRLQTRLWCAAQHPLLLAHGRHARGGRTLVPGRHAGMPCAEGRNVHLQQQAGVQGRGRQPVLAPVEVGLHAHGSHPQPTQKWPTARACHAVLQAGIAGHGCRQRGPCSQSRQLGHPDS